MPIILQHTPAQLFHLMEASSREEAMQALTDLQIAYVGTAGTVSDKGFRAYKSLHGEFLKQSKS